MNLSSVRYTCGENHKCAVALRKKYGLSPNEQFSFCHYSRLSPDKDVTIGMNPCGDYRRPSHHFALYEGTFRFGREVAALLEIIGQRGIGGASGRLFGNAVLGRKVADMRGEAVATESERMNADRLITLGDGGNVLLLS